MSYVVLPQGSVAISSASDRRLEQLERLWADERALLWKAIEALQAQVERLSRPLYRK